VLAPIIIFVYNRPTHTRQTLEALAKNDLAGQSHLFIYADGPKDDCDNEMLSRILETREIIRSKNWCKEVNILEAKDNKGLAVSIVSGITEVVNRFGKVIVLEDDIVTSTGFLNFMNLGLEYYENEDRVMDISGYSFPVKNYKLPDIFFLQMASSWGWATWSRAWKYFTDDTRLIYDSLLTENKMDSFLKIGGENYKNQLMENLSGTIHTWAIKWQAALTLQNGLSLQPGKSLVNNIGFDGTGTHYKTVDDTFSNRDIFESLNMIKVPSEKIKEDEEIAKIYRSFYLQEDNKFKNKSFTAFSFRRFLKSLKKFI
jgi:hypothetical protein